MVRFGVIGAGSIANTFCTAVNSIKGNLYAVASRDLKKAESLKETYGFEKAYGNYEDLLNDPNVDCVYVATPHALHYEQMMMILEHKKHILCEKSFTLNAKQAETILYKAKENNLFVMEAMWTRFLPIIQQAVQLVQDGIIGNITHVESSFGFFAPIGSKNRLFDLKLGAGALLDVGIYTLNFAHLFLGNPTHFESEVIMDPNGFDLSESITFHYPNAFAKMSSSIHHTLDNVGIVYGDQGYLKIPDFWKAERAFFYDLNDQLIKAIAHPHLSNGFEYEIQEVIQCIESGLTESKIMPHSTTLEIMKQMDGLRYAWGLKYPQE
ncbi:MAG: Gfo/Idh/MocA family oxidoreductase [Firmicutes bacterium]|nr:Gfo/Idh/MocA family oxidoreductase [Bacillota bacterium]